jgi:anti-anti-sigma regulatory factor
MDDEWYAAGSRKGRAREHDVPVTLQQNDAVSLVRLEGAIGIDCAAELRELLVQELQSGMAVRVSLESASGLDVTAVQLLWAAAREAKRVGVEFGFEGRAAETVWSALANAGINEFPVPA